MVYERDNLYDKIYNVLFSGDNLALNEISNKNYDGNDIAEIFTKIQGRLPIGCEHGLQDLVSEYEPFDEIFFSNYAFAQPESMSFCNILAEFLSEGNENAYNEIKTSQINGEDLSESLYFLGKVVSSYNNLY